MKLNLACGTDIRDGWVNLDVVPSWPVAVRGCDVIWDARKDKIPFPDDSAEEIYAGYLLLHLSPAYHKPVLEEIKRVLSPSGSLMVGEVDMAIVMSKWLADPQDARLSELIWGEQGSFHGDSLVEFDKHCCGFTETSLTELLASYGFSSIQRTNIHHPDVFYELTLVCRK